MPVDALPVAVIVSRYHATITAHMLAAAESAYRARSGGRADLAVLEVPGAFELPALAAEAARSGLFSGLVALGCVITGDTDHDRYINTAVANALGLLGTTVQPHGVAVPCAFGVLTCRTIEQAVARSGGATGDGPDNKGAEAMNAVLDVVSVQHRLRAAIGRPGGGAGLRLGIGRGVEDARKLAGHIGGR